MTYPQQIVGLLLNDLTDAIDRIEQQERVNHTYLKEHRLELKRASAQLARVIRQLEQENANAPDESKGPLR